MKKILLFVAATLFAMSASAQLYLKGDVNGWSAKADYQLTEKESGVYELEKSFSLFGKFKIADDAWSATANYGLDGAEADITAGVAVSVVCDGNSQNLVIPTGTQLAVTKVVLNTNDMTITVYAEEKELEDNFAYFLHGDFQVKDDWQSTALIENDGIWSISDFVVVNDPANFGVKKTNNGVQEAWYWVEDGGNVSAAAEYQFGKEGEMSGSNPQISAGTYTISFDPETLIMTVTPATATDLEETDAEDAVVAAFDITGKPVAADAAGIVILQYASGKAVKVINN